MLSHWAFLILVIVRFGQGDAGVIKQVSKCSFSEWQFLLQTKLAKSYEKMTTESTLFNLWTRIFNKLHNFLYPTSNKCTNSLAIKGANWCTSYISWIKLLSRKWTKERLPEMDMKPAILLLVTLYFSAAAGMPYLILKNEERLKWFHYALFLPTLHLCLSQQLLKYTGSRGVLTLQVIQELPTHALHM